MSNRKVKLGKVVKSHNGFNIRIELKTVEITKLDRFGNNKIIGSSRSDSGVYGVYAGKKLKSTGHKTVKDALETIS
jgi:hypothetical protein